jgi:hypothetical protein
MALRIFCEPGRSRENHAKIRRLIVQIQPFGGVR